MSQKIEQNSNAVQDELFHSIFDSAVNGIVTIDEKGTIQTANQATADLFEYEISEILNQNVTILMPSPCCENHDAYLANYLTSGERKIIGIGREVVGRKKDGSIFPLHLAVSEVFLEGKRIFAGFLNDLSDVKNAERKNNQLGGILRHSLNEIFIFDAETLRFVFVNDGASENLGYSIDELVEMSPVDIKPEFTEEQFLNLIKPLQPSKNSSLQFETVHKRKDGSLYNVYVRLQRNIWDDRESYVANIIDITERKRITDELLTRDTEIKLMVEHLPAAAAYVDYKLGHIRFNNEIRTITGYTPSELSTLDNCFSKLFGKRAPDIRALYNANHHTRSDKPLKLRIRRKDSTESVIEFRVYRYDDHEVWLVTDISEREKHETEQRIWNQAFQSVNESIVIVNVQQRKHTIVYANSAFEVMTGYQSNEVTGRELGNILLGEEKGLKRIENAIRKKTDFRIALKCVHQNGKSYWNEISIAPVKSDLNTVTHIVAVMEDVTDRRESEELLLQSERLAAIGQMVTGLAHESRNALQRAQACLDMLSLDLEDQPEQLELTGKMQKALRDLNRHYEEVRNYAAPINLQLSNTDLVRLWRDTWRNLESHRTGQMFELIEKCPEPTVVLQIDEHRIEQVFRNILENAIVASSDPGQITIAFSITDPEFVEISILDNGPGFDSEAATNVFLPFYTTKQKGTGLGMAIAKRIIESHGGEIEVVESSGKGGEVLIRLPREKKAP